MDALKQRALLSHATTQFEQGFLIVKEKRSLSSALQEKKLEATMQVTVTTVRIFKRFSKLTFLNLVNSNSMVI